MTSLSFTGDCGTRDYKHDELLGLVYKEREFPSRKPREIVCQGRVCIFSGLYAIFYRRNISQGERIDTQHRCILGHALFSFYFLSHVNSSHVSRAFMHARACVCVCVYVLCVTPNLRTNFEIETREKRRMDFATKGSFGWKIDYRGDADERKNERKPLDEGAIVKICIKMSRARWRQRTRAQCR